MIERSTTDIEDQRNKAARALMEGTEAPAMTYEEGVRDALDWVLGESDEEPIETN